MRARYILSLFMLIISCNNATSPSAKFSFKSVATPVFSKVFLGLDTLPSNLEIIYINHELIQPQDTFGNLVTDLSYSSTQNFTGTDHYGRLIDCYLQPEVALMIEKAAAFLNQEYPGLNLKLLDCARPTSVQLALYNAAKSADKANYVANPSRGSLHSLGVSVDCTLTDSLGIDLDMGSPFDDFSAISQPRFEDHFLHQGVLSRQQIENRRILREVMAKAGFRNIRTEWWHFNALDKEVARARFKVIR